jgi:hypothetical protein
MRLLKFEANGDFSLNELNSDEMQPYAILSHVWGAKDQEVTFTDLVEKTGKGKVGYEKIKFCADAELRTRKTLVQKRLLRKST